MVQTNPQRRETASVIMLVKTVCRLLIIKLNQNNVLIFHCVISKPIHQKTPIKDSRKSEKGTRSQ